MTSRKFWRTSNPYPLPVCNANDFFYKPSWCHQKCDLNAWRHLWMFPPLLSTKSFKLELNGMLLQSNFTWKVLNRNKLTDRSPKIKFPGKSNFMFMIKSRILWHTQGPVIWGPASNILQRNWLEKLRFENSWFNENSFIFNVKSNNTTIWPNQNTWAKDGQYRLAH